MGVETSYRFDKGQLFLNAKYNHGITNHGNGLTIKMYNRGVVINTGYLIPISRKEN